MEREEGREGEKERTIEEMERTREERMKAGGKGREQMLQKERMRRGRRVGTES